MTNIEIDDLSRNRIVKETDKNFLVEAGAGSGKTTMLVNRMVAMVEAGIPIDQICAITFTKAAANEFYERFQKLLIERSNPEYKWEDKDQAGQLCRPTDETRDRCAEALRNIDLCFMGTIDSFCNMILSEHPSAAKIPSDSTLITDADASQMYSQYYVRICEGEFGDELASMARTFNFLQKNGKQAFAECMPFFMDNRNVDFEIPPLSDDEKEYDIDKIFEDTRKELIRLLRFLSEHKEYMYDGNKDSIAVWEEIERLYKTIKRRWGTNYDSVLKALKKLSKLCVNGSAVEDEPVIINKWFESAGRKNLFRFRSDLTETSDMLNKLKYVISMNLFNACRIELEEELRQKGKLTFFDYLFYLRNMLKEDAECNDGKLISYISKKHRYFLIDEFQDTNPMQSEVFFYLAAETPARRWEECIPRPGSLFIVGDPKQSIYRFRGADVRSFLYIKELFSNERIGEVLSLSRNFRSTKIMCEYFNRVFPGILQQSDDQSNFEEIPVPKETADEFQGVFQFRTFDGQALDSYPLETDTIKIPEIIDTLVNKEEYKIRAKGDKEPRPIQYGDFMVITYNKKKLAPLMKVFRETGIPVKVEGKIPFETNEALKESFRIYSAVTDTDDVLSLYGALTGGVFGLLDRDILDYKECGGYLSLKRDFDRLECKNEYALMVADAMADLKTWSIKAQTMSPAALFVGIVEGFKLFTHVSASNLEVLYYTMELIRNAEKVGIIVNHKDCVQYVSELLSGKSDQERCLALSEKTNSVRMANLHKVKGLEAPIVILASASTWAIPVYKRIEHTPEETKGYVFNMKPENATFTTPPYFETGFYKTTHQAAEEFSRDAETQRLIYVGATRARNALIISQRHTEKKGGDITCSSKWKVIVEPETPDIFEYLGGAHYEAKPAAETKDPKKLYKKGEKESVIKPTEDGNLRNNERSTYSIVNPSMLRVLSKVSYAENGEDEEKVVEVDKRYPRLLGTTVHRLMEIIVSSKGKVNEDAAIDEIIREFIERAESKLSEKLKCALKSVATTMTNGGYPQTNGVPRDLFSVLLNADEVYCEVPFSYKNNSGSEDAIIKGIMDVVYCSEGEWHIVDYKTNAEGNDLDIKYQNQLAAYIKAFKEITGNDVDALTYHIDV